MKIANKNLAEYIINKNHINRIDSLTFISIFQLKVMPDICFIILFFMFKESAFETRKNISYFNLKAFFVLEIFKF